MAYFLIRTGNLAQAAIPVADGDLDWGRPCSRGYGPFERIMQFLAYDYTSAVINVGDSVSTTIAFVDDAGALTVTARYMMYRVRYRDELVILPLAAFNHADLEAQTIADRFGFYVSRAPQNA